MAIRGYVLEEQADRCEGCARVTATIDSAAVAVYVPIAF